MPTPEKILRLGALALLCKASGTYEPQWIAQRNYQPACGIHEGKILDITVGVDFQWTDYCNAQRKRYQLVWNIHGQNQ